MKFETVRIHFLSDVSGLLSSRNFATKATSRNDFYYIHTEKYSPKSYVVNFRTQISSSQSESRTMFFHVWEERKGDSFLISISLTPLWQKPLFGRFRRQKEKQYRSPHLPPFFCASIREGRVALSVGHPRGIHSCYVIGCCLIPLGICSLKNNSRRITYGIGCVWGMPSLSPLSSLGTNS